MHLKILDDAAGQGVHDLWHYAGNDGIAYVLLFYIIVAQDLPDRRPELIGSTCHACCQTENFHSNFCLSKNTTGNICIS